MGAKKSALALLALIIISLIAPASSVGLVSAQEDTTFPGGDGSPGDPYQISNVTELQAIKDDLSAHYILVNNIDASDTVTWNDCAGFEPIGNYDNALLTKIVAVLVLSFHVW